jgi:predicted N-formylglutamate amidohydrolase
MTATALAPLLTAGDPPPVEVVNGDGAAPLLLVCEHAGQAVPQALGTLGVDAEVLDSHRGWDIGAEQAARRLAQHLDAPLILQRYSRLVIDCNRPPGSPSSILEESDGAAIPANRGLSPTDKAARVAEIFDPMNREIDRAFATHARRAAFAIHSFTPSLAGFDRPWHAGFLTRASIPTAERLIASVAAADRDLNLALNQPYQIEDETDWFIPAHAEPRALPHCLVEIRNDLLRDAAGADRWADLLARAVKDVLGSLP